LKTTQRRGRERKIIFIGLISLLFYAYENIGPDLWALLLSEVVQNISNRRNVRVRYKADAHIAYGENVILGNNSGFQKLSFLKESKVYFELNWRRFLKNFKVEVSGICEDEEKYFAVKFNEFCSNPQIKINIGNILNVQQQVINFFYLLNFICFFGH